MGRHMAGSLLASEGHDTLTPMTWRDVVLQVVPDEALQTYHLVLTHEAGGKSVLASHPNGYSCHELAKRIVSGSEGRALAQHKFIAQCGGSICDEYRIRDLLGRTEAA